MKKRLLYPIFLASALFTASCATQKTKDASLASPAGDEKTVASADGGADKGEPVKKTLSDDEIANAAKEMKASEIENQTIDEIIRTEEPNTQSLYDNSRYDFPITMNARVEGWIDYFTGRGREHMERYLARSSRYIPRMKQALKASGLPQDLVYLALIESGFNLKAKSRTRAVGPWQFMKGTGKRYGLRVDAWIDERRDPIRSTEAAAKYLKDLYLMFESWYLAASAYNAGEYRILRAIDETKTNNYWRICETRALPRETKDYVPKLIAAAIIAKNPQKYGFDKLTYDDGLDFETVNVDFPVHLKDIASLVDAQLDDLQDLNPELIRDMVPPGTETYEVRVPVGSKIIVERAIAGIREKTDEDAMPLQYKLHAGETLATVSRKYHVSVKALAEANNLSRKEKVAPGSTLIIPSRRAAMLTEAHATRAKRNLTAQAFGSGSAEFTYHTVRHGESLWSIAEKYDVTVQDLFKWNNLKKSKLVPGKKLRVRARSGGAEAADGVSALHRSKTKVALYKAPKKKRSRNN